MILTLIPACSTNTILHGLPENDMVVDPRPCGCGEESMYRFKANVPAGTSTLWLTRITNGDDEQKGWDHDLYFRVYSSNEHHHSFDSTFYLLNGLFGETAPLNTTEAIIKDGVGSVPLEAFRGCSCLEKVTFPDTIDRIQHRSFLGCSSLQNITLPPLLRYIGVSAFQDCSCLETIYIPQSVSLISDDAFANCASLTIINIPENTRLGINIICDCHQILTPEMNSLYDKGELNKWLSLRYNTFQRMCWNQNPSITAQAITEYIQSEKCTTDEDEDEESERMPVKDNTQMTALHLLAANPYVNHDMICAYMELAPDVALARDSTGRTPLHLLCSLSLVSQQSSDGAGAIGGFLQYAEGREAAFVRDAKGKTALDYVCLSLFDNLSFLRNKSFSGLLIWWYGQMGMDLLSAGERNVQNPSTRKRKSPAI